jgi:putative DNA primase/helicase
MATRLRVAIICNNHFSKGGGSANNRVIGSVAFVNQARAAFIVATDDKDPTRRLLIPSKMNIAAMGQGLAYRIEGCQIEGGISTSRIMYESTPINITADQALAALGNCEGRSQKSEAIDFLKTIGGREVDATEVKRNATEAGITPKSLRSAREDLGIKPQHKGGFGPEGRWVWDLTKMPNLPKMPQDAHGLKQGILAKEGTLGGITVGSSCLSPDGQVIPFPTKH